MLTSAEIRQQFLDFFASKGHVIVPSAPIVVKNDPTLLFTNAGMNQFKDYFLGNKQPPYTRVADTQKCLRVSGKHNDLEEVGVDTYHHTMFEMLGNWSFGDYFKKDAIAWSWELLTQIYKIPIDRLYVTVFEGDAKENIPPSSIALKEWQNLVAADHIVFGNKKDNFWEMGDTGPCGPCSEIHVDCRSDDERARLPGNQLVNKDHPQVIEIWNNVFIQYNRKKDGSLEPLPATHVDTGMGLERLVRVLQGKSSNYDTDVFTGTIAATAKITGKVYGFSDSRADIAFRVIADHIRAIAFTIADGQLPSNTGAGYVIRRILRRAVRYYYSYLDYKQPLLFQLLPVLAAQFEKVFPELYQQLDFVTKVVKEEEDGFLRTLDKGLKKMEDIISSAQKTPHATINGSAAFELYDTYGFPVDLTRLIGRENNLQVDEAGFEKEMQQQKDRSRAATAVDTEDWIVLDNSSLMEFLGYDTLEIDTKVMKYRKVKAKGKESYQVVLAATPFYAESGGQVGDSGILVFEDGEVKVFDTKKENDLIIHYVDKLPMNIDGPVVARVDRTLRNRTEAHHSATHLLHAALRQVLGSHVAQKGSLVNAEQLRFDFSHFAKLTEEEIVKIEDLVNEKIRENIAVQIDEMPKDEAISMGAMALFGEKYSDIVRVVVMDKSYSIELCGGTHVAATGELGYFKLKHESAVAAGVRRIEAISGSAAAEWLKEQLAQLQQVKEILKHPKELPKAIEATLAENTQLRKQLESLENRALVGIRKGLLEKNELVNGMNFVGGMVEVSNPDALKKLSYDLKNELDNYIAVLCANIGGKPSVAISISDGLVAGGNWDAGKLIREIVAPLIKGGGGGQKNLATAGGQDAGRLPEVLSAVKEAVSRKL
ncbi:alanine--tRNA ligase [Flavihumibacter fluvii]|uniref:alanine--tRNA ligase n=1 Tax=Flavihumibacter fluvii TaxID=2838157 RepID=UPI001BDEE997|nr:alanine--tRNA ligase [Flavihumibacter fluvii]ULQ51220.1 alanine--tRNA ligase [Flavihumibacter fluvii]